jgi:Zn-dependent metalloprotease
MKRMLLVLAVVALVVTLLPGFIGSPTPAIANVDTPVPLRDGTPQPQDIADAAPPAAASAGLPLSYAPDLTGAADLALVARLQAAAGPARVATHMQTGRVRFIGSDVTAAAGGAPAFRGVATGIEGQPDVAARAFLSEYGALFGIEDPATLRVEEQETDTASGLEPRAFVRYQQTVNGIPVLGGEIVAQVDNAGTVWSASGEALPEGDTAALPTAPNIDAGQAQQTAIGVTAKHEQVAVETLTASAAELWYYAPELLGRPSAPTTLAWRVEVTTAELLPIRQLVLVDALSGHVALTFNQAPHAKNRIVYDNQNTRGAGLPGWGPVRTEGGGATGIGDVDLAYDYAGDTYDFYLGRHGRDSLDGAGMPLISTVRFCYTSGGTCPYNNAFWNGAQMVYGQGLASADDVVAHELTHGVTDYESQLFYYMQSGALNESLSDIWGEFVDQTNGKGNDSAASKWLIGEDDPPSLGILRSMKDPTIYGDPDRVGSGNYYCGLDDNGGVHWNSGVPNKAAFLMTDGGAFNGKTVSPLGLEKVARIWYRMAALTLTSGGEFQDAYDLLPQACMDYAATNAAGITVADCQEVKDALDATQMNAQPASCSSTEAPVCAAGEGPQYLYNENFENQGLTQSRWFSAASVGPNPWYYPQTVNPYNFAMNYAGSGLLHLWGDNLGELSDGSIEMSQPVGLPNTSQLYMRFRHSYDFEFSGSSYYDGAVLEYSANGGGWTDAAPLFTHNGYDGLINSPETPYNPLRGRQGFRGVSWGYQSSRLNLASFAGQNIRFRFRVGADGSYTGWFGWVVDDVQIYRCVTVPTPTPTPTFTPTPTKTPSTPWINWAVPYVPPASKWAARPARVLFGSVTAASTATGTITGNATFEDGSGSQNKSVPVGSGEIQFLVKAKPGAAPGADYTLSVKMGSVTITKSGKVAREIRLPLLLK